MTGPSPAPPGKSLALPYRAGEPVLSNPDSPARRRERAATMHIPGQSQLTLLTRRLRTGGPAGSTLIMSTAIKRNKRLNPRLKMGRRMDSRKHWAELGNVAYGRSYFFANVVFEEAYDSALLWVKP